eukprot:958755-Pelagomonas_calceolata.AAC.1
MPRPPALPAAAYILKAVACTHVEAGCCACHTLQPGAGSGSSEPCPCARNHWRLWCAGPAHGEQQTQLAVISHQRGWPASQTFRKILTLHA